MSNASFISGSEEEAMLPKFVVPVRAFHPLSLLRISSARHMWRDSVEEGESLPTFVA
jgi:hypothetical protein